MQAPRASPAMMPREWGVAFKTTQRAKNMIVVTDYSLKPHKGLRKLVEGGALLVAPILSDRRGSPN